MKAQKRSGRIAVLSLWIYSLTSTRDGGRWSTTRPGPGPGPGPFTLSQQTRYPFHRRQGESQGHLDECGKSRPHWDSIPSPSSP